jgi:hypothetical protein
MVDKSGLKVIGWLLGGATAAVMMIAAVLVTEAVASNPSSAGHGPAPIASAADAR